VVIVSSVSVVLGRVTKLIACQVWAGTKEATIFVELSETAPPVREIVAKAIRLRIAWSEIAEKNVKNKHTK